MKVFKIGDSVFDDLTSEVVVIVKVDIDTRGNLGYFVNHGYLGGGRHPWEVSSLEDQNKEKEIH